MSHPRHHVLWAIALALTPLAAFAQAQPAPDTMTGIAIGEEAPDFTLTGHDGKTVTLSEMIKTGPVAVVFYRSADW